MRSHDEKNRGTTKKDWVWKRNPARHAALHDLVPWQHLPVEGEVPSHFTGASYPSRSYQVSRCPIESDVVTAFNGLEGILLWDSISCRQHQHAEGLLRGRMLEFEITGSVCSIPLL